MEFLKKVLLVITGLAMIVLVVYVIDLSQKSQRLREMGGAVTEQEEVIPPQEREAPPDTMIGEPAPAVPDTLPKPVVKPDSIRWRRLPEKEPSAVQGAYPQGNPNPIFIAAARRILPSVVTIQSMMMVKSIPDDDTHKFFREKFGEEEEEQFRPGSGSGIIISPNGYILTNYHVIEKASDFSIILYDKREYHGQYIGGDPNTDIALLKIEAENLPAAYMGNSDSVQIGEWVMAVGSPLNFSSTITAGIVSALGRDIRIINQQYGVENFIQTDAVINPGNSGGALINLNGEVIGINTAIATRTGLYQGYGFAIPSNLAMKVVDDILKYGEVHRGLLGVSISPVNDMAAKGLGLPRPMGVLVQGLQPGLPAEQAGIRQGDVILSVNGEEVTSVNDLQLKIARKSPGEVVELEIWREGKTLLFRVPLAQAPVTKSNPPIKKEGEKQSFQNLGMKVRNLSAGEKRSYETENGVYIEDVKIGSPAHKVRVFPGEILISINDEPVTGESDFQRKISRFKKGDILKLLLRSRGFRNQIDNRIVFLEVQ